MTNKITSSLKLLLVFSSLSITCLILSNILSLKIITLSIDRISISMTLPCFMLYPFVFIISDVVSNCYGYKCSRLLAWLGFTASAFCSVIFYIQTLIPGDPDLNILHSTWILTLSSLIAYLISGWVNDIIFDKMLQKSDNNTEIIRRCIYSSIVGHILDSFIFLFLGMWLLPLIFYKNSIFILEEILIMTAIQVIIKISFELVCSPLTNYLCKKINKYIH